ncbi:hypothetical protein D3C81_1367120 [compost metagenome]
MGAIQGRKRAAMGGRANRIAVIILDGEMGLQHVIDELDCKGMISFDAMLRADTLQRGGYVVGRDVTPAQKVRRHFLQVLFKDVRHQEVSHGLHGLVLVLLALGNPLGTQLAPLLHCWIELRCITQFLVGCGSSNSLCPCSHVFPLLFVRSRFMSLRSA